MVIQPVKVITAKIYSYDDNGRNKGQKLTTMTMPAGSTIKLLLTLPPPTKASTIVKEFQSPPPAKAKTYLSSLEERSRPILPPVLQ
jgi:hypothetical protein